jgi:DnaJ-class molecular chaperone
MSTYGKMGITAPCPRCNGEGHLKWENDKETLCFDCNGLGVLEVKQAMNEAKTILTRLWPDGTVEVMTRETPSDVWGIPAPLSPSP